MGQKVCLTDLGANGLAINLEKCMFAVPTLEILGQMVLAAGSAPLGRTHRHDSHLFPSKDIKQLQHFLSTVNFYCCLLPSCDCVLWPLTDILKGGTKMLEFPKCKAPPSHGGTISTSGPQCWAFLGHWHLWLPHGRYHATKIRRSLASSRIFLQKVDWDGISLFHFWSGVDSSLSVHSKFPPFLWRSSVWPFRQTMTVMSRVTAHILPCQQRHLAFISKLRWALPVCPAKCCHRFFVPPLFATRIDERVAQPQRFWGDGRWAKTLPGNEVLALWNHLLPLPSNKQASSATSAMF